MTMSARFFQAWIEHVSMGFSNVVLRVLSNIYNIKMFVMAMFNWRKQIVPWYVIICCICTLFNHLLYGGVRLTVRLLAISCQLCNSWTAGRISKKWGTNVQNKKKTCRTHIKNKLGIAFSSHRLSKAIISIRIYLVVWSSIFVQIKVNTSLWLPLMSITYWTS